jgi:hypothetical protein
VNIAACLTSKNEHYCSPPAIVDPMRRLLIPRGSGRKLIDLATNDASQVGAHFSADGVEVDGLTVDASVADCWFCNPPYGSKIKSFAERFAYWGGTRGLPGLALLPARDDPAWAQEQVYRTASAWVHVRGRLTFWLPIPLAREDAPPVEGEHNGEDRYYLRRWFAGATDERLPAPFRSLAPGYAIGPELGANGKPQSAPFPSLVAFWADPEQEDRDPLLERDCLRELVRRAEPRTVAGPEHETWLAEAECLLGSRRFNNRAPLDLDVFRRWGETAKIDPANRHPITTREFAKRFLPLGMLTIARGPNAGVWFR